MKALLAVVGCCLTLTGCNAVTGSASTADCSVLNYNFSTTPITETLSHSAAPPGNQVQFSSTMQATYSTPQGQVCALPTSIARVQPVWTNPEPLDITISSAQDETNGTAVCLASTGGPVTLTATEASGQKTYTSSVSLTCQ